VTHAVINQDLISLAQYNAKITVETHSRLPGRRCRRYATQSVCVDGSLANHSDHDHMAITVSRLR